MDAEPRVSVILPCRNEARHIEQCLRSIAAQQPPQGGFEVVLADGMSEDGTREVLARWEKDSAAGPRPSIRVVDNPGRITSAGLNRAIRAARGSIIVRMDAHTEYAPDYVCRCVEVLERTGADNVGGPWVAVGSDGLSGAIAAAFGSAFAVGGARGHRSGYEGPVDTVYLGCWRKSAFEKFGEFDEELVRNQDDEHNLRLLRRGGRIWQDPIIRSWYRPRGSLSALFRQYMQYGYWKVRVIQKHKLPASPRHLVPGAFVLGLGLLTAAVLAGGLGSLVLGHPLPGVGVVSALWAGLTGLYAAGVLAASLLTAAQTQWRLLPVLPPVFACFHFGYGYGFLRGTWDFLIRRRPPRTGFVQLTR